MFSVHMFLTIQKQGGIRFGRGGMHSVPLGGTKNKPPVTIRAINVKGKAAKAERNPEALPL